MKRFFLSFIGCLCLCCGSSMAEGTSHKGAWADINYRSMLLFDELSGRLLDIVVPQEYQSPFQLREQGVSGHVTGFQNDIDIKRSPVPMKLELGVTNVVKMKILPLEFVRPKVIADYSVSMRGNEFTGESCFLWDADEWKNVPVELSARKEVIISSRGHGEASIHYGKPIPAENKIVLDKALWQSLVVRQTKCSPESFYAPKYVNEANKQYRKTKLDLVRLDDDRLKTVGDDTVFEMLLDRSSGYLAVYIRYQNKDEPKDIDVSVIRKMIDPDELTAVVWDYWVRPGTEPGRRLKSEKAADLANKTQSKTQGDGDDTSFTIRVNQVFGTVRPIWELEIWAELGRRIQESKKPYILAFNEEDIKELKQPEISQTYLVVSPELYKAMEVLRETSDKTTRLEDEREPLKGMLSQ